MSNVNAEKDRDTATSWSRGHSIESMAVFQPRSSSMVAVQNSKNVLSNLLGFGVTFTTNKEDVDNPIRKSNDNDNIMIRDSSSLVPAFQENVEELPDMWSWPYIGLYCQYAAVGLLYGTSGALLSLCVYVYDGDPNLCANSSSISFFAWNFKIIYAIITDSIRPFGLRRRPWMIAGWVGVLVLLLTLSITADTLNASDWLSLLLVMQCFVMLSDVPADGYCVELGQREPPERRGVILATGQMIRFSCCVVSGLVQAVLLNGPTTNRPDCPIGFSQCWASGLTIKGYYTCK